MKSDLADFLSGPTLFDPRDRAQEAFTVHKSALALASQLHDLPVQDANERARIYRDELLAVPASACFSTASIWLSVNLDRFM